MSDPLLHSDNHELAMRQHYAAVHTRLMRGAMPAAKPSRPRPVSPFLRKPETKPAMFPLVVQIPVAKWRAIVAEVAAKHDVKARDILGPCRERWLVPARHEAAFRIFTETRLSLPEIAMRMGDRDHTTILHSLRWMSKNVEGADDALAAAKERRHNQARTEARNLSRKARRLREEGMTPMQILDALPISETALREALKRPKKTVARAKGAENG